MTRTFLFRSPVHLDRLCYKHLLHRPNRLFTSSSSQIISPYTPVTLQKDVLVRRMRENDLNLILKWAKELNWNPGQHEVSSLFAADPKGYYLLEVDGKPTASLAAVQYSSRLAFLGLFIVAPSKRRQGYGALLWDFVTHQIEQCSTVGLNAVMEQRGRYEKAGFSPSFLSTRWCGMPKNIPTEFSTKETFSLTDNVSLQALANYDNRIFSEPRTAFLTQWINMPQSHILAALDHHGKIVGYGVISRTVEENSYKIAPLFASTKVVAQQLYGSLCRFVGKEARIYVDIPETSPYASFFIEQFKLEKVFDTLRMYKGDTPAIKQDEVVGLTSLEIGG